MNGQTEGLSRTWLPGVEHAGFFDYEHVVGHTPLHPGWGVHLADEDAAPQLEESAVSFGAGGGTGGTAAERWSSLALKDSQGTFLAYGNVNRRLRCNTAPNQPNQAGSTGVPTLYLRNAAGELAKVDYPTSVQTLPNVDAGDQATPDGRQRTTTVQLQRRVQGNDGLALWHSEFPGTYEVADGLHIRVTQQVGTEPPTVYDFLVSGGACAA
ncbi:hypothetical protein [Lentzea sp. NPDC003310]|uniref:hypothetical protein n=1 Tax=Lentzea sp. NPDC003310 TaxID=3154447 RepID=UPI00339E1C97